MARQTKAEKLTVSKILRISDDTNNAIKARADELGISQNDVILKAIEAYLGTADTVSDTSVESMIDAKLEPILERLVAIEKKRTPSNDRCLDTNSDTTGDSRETFVADLPQRFGNNKFNWQEFWKNNPGIDRPTAEAKVQAMAPNMKPQTLQKAMQRHFKSD